MVKKTLKIPARIKNSVSVFSEKEKDFFLHPLRAGQSPCAAGAWLLPPAAQDAAGNFFSRIPGRLAFEIIGMRVDNDGTPNDLRDGKAVGKKGKVCFAAVAKQRRQIAGVCRMRTFFGVEMRTGVRKRVFAVAGAGFSLVNMKTEYVCGAVAAVLRQSLNPRGKQYPFAQLAQLYHTAQIRMRGAPF